MNDPVNKKVFRFDDILDDVVKMYEAEPLLSQRFGTLIPYDGRLINLPFNKAYSAYLPLITYNRFRDFCVSMFAHQGSICIHPLTCGVDSSHELLVPRIIISDNLHVIVCPTCGYVQPMFNTP